MATGHWIVTHTTAQKLLCPVLGREATCPTIPGIPAMGLHAESGSCSSDDVDVHYNTQTRSAIHCALCVRLTPSVIYNAPPSRH